jgi:palmitoyltransferase ZDHHC9/14/18
LFIKKFQTTYENFRYRADSRPNYYDRGCFNNFVEVFCTEVKPSRNNFRACVKEEQQTRALPVSLRQAPEEDEPQCGPPRAKVEDDLEIGDDLLKISRRRDFEEVGDELRSVVSESLPGINSGRGLETGSGRRDEDKIWDFDVEVGQKEVN